MVNISKTKMALNFKKYYFWEMEDHVASDRAQSRKAPAQGQEVRKHQWGLTQMGSQANRVELRHPGDSQLMAEAAEGGGDCRAVTGFWVVWANSALRCETPWVIGKIREVGWRARECCHGACLDVCGHPWGSKMGPVLSSWKITGDEYQYFIWPVFWQKKIPRDKS